VVVSALRNFSAPIKLIQVRTEQQAERELMHIAKYDEDLFNRAEAIFQMSVGVVLAQYQQQADAAVKIDRLCEVFANVLDHADRDWAMAAEMLTLPTEGLLGDQVKELDPAKMRAARIAVRQALASRLRAKWLDIYTRLQLKQPYQMSADQIAMRAMKHVALGFLCELPESDGGKDAFVLAKAHFEHADNLTERVGALSAMLIQKKPSDIAALQDMYEQFKQEALVIDRWFQLQATARQTNVEHIRLLMQHPLFSMTNPNRMRSLLSAFFGGNAAQFHNEQGYRLWEETVVFLNEKNPQVAARIARLLERYRHFEPRLQTLIHASLTRLQARSDLVSDVREIINKALQF
jgi:aminopeptidase N